MGWSGFLLAYLLGGLTFVPLVVAVVFAHAYFTLPHRHVDDPFEDKNSVNDSLVAQPDDNDNNLRADSDLDKDKDSNTSKDRDTSKDRPSKDRDISKPWGHDSDVASGYFAVCREYTPMGINAKPIERSTPVGSATVAAPSQSVYQTMYRSIFERKQAPGPLDDKGGVSQRPKKAGNVFYVVLRHGHLMLFDDEEQLEVRHVISLAHHNVSIYSGSDTATTPIPEGELWIKRSALCLSRKKDGASDTQTSKPFYLFSENCSAKEDFYFALLRNQDLSFGGDSKSPAPLGFDVKDILSLVQRLHSTEEHMHTRWLNALIGRIFLSINRTADFENFIREKLTTKISRVKRPTFLSDISIRAIDPGDSAPWIMNPRLRDLNVEGECLVEADVRYTGNFRIEVATTARIDLGARFKVREVDLVLAVVLRKIEGHMLFKVKPPPSNRIWQTFQAMPKIELTIEPIVSARQITYTVILRQIENRIKEVVAETMVLPFWDDTPFFRTEHKRYRGGIFEGDDAVVKEDSSSSSSLMAGAMERIQRERFHKEQDDNKSDDDDDDDDDDKEENEKDSRNFEKDPPPHSSEKGSDLRNNNFEKSQSVPNLLETTTQLGGLFNRKVSSRGGSTPKISNSSSVSLDTAPPPEIHLAQPPQSPRPAHTAEPAKPVVVMANAQDHHPESEFIEKPDVRSRASFSSATSNSGANSLSAPSKPPMAHYSPTHSSASSQNEEDPPDDDDENLAPPTSRRNTASSSSESMDRHRCRTTTSSSSESIDRPLPSPSPSIRSTSTSNTFSSTSTGNPFSSASTGNPFSPRRESLGSDTPPLGIAKRTTTLAAVTNAAAQATAQARQWGWNALQRRKDQQAAKKGHTRGSSVDLSQPMGGGRPFPPPGTPLPGPETPPTKIAPSTSSSNLHSSFVAGGGRPALPPRPAEDGQELYVPRKRLASIARERRQHSAESLMVVEAPEESEPTTPVSGVFEREGGSTTQTTQTVTQETLEEEEEVKKYEEKDTAQGVKDKDTESIPTPPLLVADEHTAQKVGGYPRLAQGES